MSLDSSKKQRSTTFLKIDNIYSIFKGCKGVSKNKLATIYRNMSGLQNPAIISLR